MQPIRQIQHDPNDGIPAQASHCRIQDCEALVRLCHLSILILLLPLVSGSSHSQTPLCTAADLYVSFHFHDDAESVERITLLARKISGHGCLLTTTYPRNFVSAQQPNGPPNELGRPCATR